VEFLRGFVEALDLDARTFAEHGEEIRAAHRPRRSGSRLAPVVQAAQRAQVR
jgi:hypothetical protein